MQVPADLRLRFEDPAIEAAWRASILDGRTRRFRIGIGLIGCLIALAGLRDLVMGLDRSGVLLALRFAVAVPVCAAAIGVTYTRVRHRLDDIAFLSVASLGLFFTVPATLLRAAAGYEAQGALAQFTGFVFILLGLISSHLVLGVTFRHANALGVVNLLTWLVTVLIAPPPPNTVAVQGFLLVSANAMCVFAGFVVERSERAAFAANRLLAFERARSEQLLRNMLPGPIAERLKNGTTAIADHHPSVTVLFLDLVGFTAMSTRVTPEELVRRLNRVFTAFDRLVAERDLEKVKTIGDAYMVAAGVPVARTDHAEAVADLALGMIDVVRTVSVEIGDTLEARIGIHTGPVVAGVIGERKFAYDMWGDTVNTASRMESSGEPGRIHLSKEAADRLSERFVVEPRGTITVKGKGPVETAWLVGRRPALPVA